MKIVKNIEDAVNAKNIPRGAVIYTGGNAATPQVLLRQLAKNDSIKNVTLLSVLLLGEIQELFTKETCERIEHRVIFNGSHPPVLNPTFSFIYTTIDMGFIRIYPFISFHWVPVGTRGIYTVQHAAYHTNFRFIRCIRGFFCYYLK